MDLSELEIEKFSTFVINELKAYGIKCQKEKKKKYTQKKRNVRNVFCTHLNLLDLSDVILANGKAVKVPHFLTVACSRILDQVETEGLFRKAGSIARQRELRAGLEVGEQLNKSHHVIDVANVIKYFFRELPSPLITPCIQETLHQCLLLRENNIDAMLLACLLLPPLAINTLCFFMQFLHTVSLSENRNKMTIQNLAIIFTPSLMPFPHVKSQRFLNHVKIVRILIENANSIGIIPPHIELKLRETSNIAASEGYLTDIFQKSKNKITDNNGQVPSSTKKKRRSDIFHGLRKIVGSTMGSTELLDNSFEGNKTKLSISKSEKKINKTDQLIVDEISENKKRKYIESDSAFKTKKNETKKTRLSLGGERILKSIAFNSVATSVERRWSIVGSDCSKNRNGIFKKSHDSSNCISDTEFSGIKEVDDKSNDKFETSQFFINDNNEFEEEKMAKVKSIESQASKEMLTVPDTPVENNFFSVNTRSPDHCQTKPEEMSTETESLSSPSTEQLVQCLSRKLSVRRSINHRSSRENKTETIRRRSQNKMQISTCNIQLFNTSPEHEKPSSSVLKFQNTQFSGSLNNSFAEAVPFLPSKNHNPAESNERINEQWLPGEEFFRKTQAKTSKSQENENFATPVRMKINSNFDKTPMLPPKSLPRKTPNKLYHSAIVEKTTMSTKLNRTAMCTPDIEEINGRASIARLREENAGMVMAKAKLFDSLETKTYNWDSKATEQNSIKIHSSNSNTPVSTPSKQRHRYVSKSSSKQLTKSVINNSKLTKPGTVNFEIGRKAQKPKY